jgi:hypothetical protein
MGKSSPKTPDPYKVSAAQTESNIKTAQEQARLAMTGQETPWGSINYVADPNSPSGYRAVTSLSEDQQGLLDQTTGLRTQAGGRLGELMGTPFDLNAARATELSDIQRTFLDPQWDQRSSSLETQLLNRGIRPGSAQYENMRRQFGQQQNDAYNQMYLGAYNTANNAALQERQLPFQEYAAVSGIPQQQSVNPAQAPTPGVAPTDISGNVWNAYNQKSQQANANMGGIYGLAGNLAGGWASAGFPGVTAALGLLSDRRMKADIERIGDDPRGWGVYRWRYLFGDDVHEGFMADEIEAIRPDVVFTASTGVKSINYAALEA